MSRSSKGNPFRNGHYGSNHYQRRGLLGGLANFFGSGSSGGDRYYPGDYPNTPEAYGQQAMICPKCNAQIPNGSKFCAQCGAKITSSSFCQACGEKLSLTAKFCSGCGAKTTPE